MKKLTMLLAVLAMAAVCTPAMADWSVTTTWTRSVGPGLASEQVFLDSAVKCTVLPAAPTTCQFNVATLSGQSIKVRSINAQGSYSETTPVILSAVPAPPTGLLINITYVTQ